jgi:TPR repeat protein
MRPVRATWLFLLAMTCAPGCGPPPPPAEPLLALGEPVEDTAAALFFNVMVIDPTAAYGGTVTVVIEGPLGQPQSRHFELELRGAAAAASQPEAAARERRPVHDELLVAGARPGAYVLVAVEVDPTPAAGGAAPLPRRLTAVVERRFTVPAAKLVYLGTLQVIVAARDGGPAATLAVATEPARTLAATLRVQRRGGPFVEALMRRSPGVLVPGLVPPLTLDTAGLSCEPKDARACTERCDRGDARSCRDLGRFHDEGRGVAKDRAAAVARFARACELGLGLGCTELGWMHESGAGGPKDAGRAASLYRQACLLGDAHGCTNQGWLYDGAGGVTQDPARAAALYLRGCEGGSYRGCNNLGWLYHHGRGVPRDDARAAQLFKRSCAGGLANGCSAHGWMVAVGRGTPKDRAAGLAGLRGGCAAGSVVGCRMLAEFCGEGDGLACHLLAGLHAAGAGVAKDPARAADLTRQACQKGHAAACQAPPAGAPAP